MLIGLTLDKEDARYVMRLLIDRSKELREQARRSVDVPSKNYWLERAARIEAVADSIGLQLDQ